MPETPSHLSLEEVDTIARLARLRLSPEERVQYQKQVSDILTYVDTLQQLDTSKLEATFRMGTDGTALRADEPGPSLPVADAVANAPDRQQDYFRIPRILDEE